MLVGAFVYQSSLGGRTHKLLRREPTHPKIRCEQHRRLAAMSPVLDLAARVAAVPAQSGIRRGAFIVFEGADRAGKSTQCKKLVEHLTGSGVKAELWRFPDRKTPVGQMIDSYLGNKSEIDDAAVHLLFSANRWEKRALMLSKLKEGTTLVVDRYAYSGAAFTSAKDNPDLSLDWCKAPDKGLPAPDAVIYLDLPLKVAQARGGFGEERYETTELQKRVAEQFRKLFEPSWHILDARRTVEEIHLEACNIAHEAVEQAAHSPEVGKLWWESSSAKSPSREPLSDMSV